MNLLILGADSLVGQALAEVLARQDQAYSALDTQAFLALKKGELIKSVTRCNPTQVIYTATFDDLALAERDEAAARQCDLINSVEVTEVAEVCEKLQLPLLYHSSSYVFDGRKVHPYQEDDEASPQCRYGQSKLAGERTLRDTLPKHLILRTDWVFDRRQPAYFAQLLQRFRDNGGKLRLMSRRFNPTPASDVARVMLGIARQIDCAADVWGTYHYGALQAVAQEVFAEQLLQEAARYDPMLAALLPALEITREPVTAPWIGNSSLSAQRLFETFGIKQRSRAGELSAILQALCNYTPPVQPDTAPAVEAAPASAPADTERAGGGTRRRLRKKPGSAKPASKDAGQTK
ncbi:MAG TPA: sugar nucleotide-binding protein [Hyphomicrobiales bacterium]|nr:sugar nucleotide-binding protein [Hyphomicrobiales bacterium]